MNPKAKIFLCYARQDEAKVSALYEKLSLASFHPFMAPKDILPGENWKQVIMNTIREAPFFLVCLSTNSVDKRGVIQEEIREALDLWRQKLDSDIYFIPVRLEDCRVPAVVEKFQWVDLFRDDGFGLLRKAINVGMERLGIIRPLRSKGTTLSHQDVTLMVRERDFYDQYMNSVGRGITHEYEQQGQVVFDATTGLTWQQSGLPESSFYAEAEKYISDLNKEELAGYTDWRLPTLEEAMSLIEPYKHGLFRIDPVFDRTQRLIWTADKMRSWVAWYVDFIDCFCYYTHVDTPRYVRAVRSRQ